MATQLLDLPVPTSIGGAVVAQMAACIEELVLLAGQGALVESPTGRLVAHLLDGPESIGANLVEALISGDLCHLHSTLTDRRSTGVLPTGPVIQAVLGDDGSPHSTRIAYLTLREAGQPVGGVWLLLSSGRRLALEELRAPASRLASLLSCTTTDQVQLCLNACLQGEPDARLPLELRDATQWWVAGLMSGPDISPELAQRALAAGGSEPSRSRIRARATVCSGQLYLVLAGDRKTTATEALFELKRITESASKRLGQPLSAGLSDPCDMSGLPTAKVQADAAADAGTVGECVSLAEVRPGIILRQLGKTVAALPDLGQDPLVVLDAYDSRRGSDFAASLLAWLNCFGDIPQTADVLGLHENTLRYRIRRIQEIIGVDLRQQPAARLELHVRLMSRSMLKT